MTAKRTIRLTVNGRTYERTIEVRMTLADFLREELNLTGTHLGCEHGICGACTILFDGEAVRSCLLLAVQADGASLMTVEGLAQGEELHPLQQAFHEHHALQCGFCTPGFLMTAVAFLKDTQNPSEAQVRRQSPATSAVAPGMRPSYRLSCKQDEEDEMDQTYIGAPIRRREDFRLLTGRATFTDDIKLPQMLHAAILRSPHAHARITSVDATKALAIPGTVAVFTFQDIAPWAKPIPLRLYPLPGLEQFLQYPLARDKVRYVGEPVAVVVAENRYLAEDALDAMDVAYEPLLAVTDVRQSLKHQIIIHEEPATNLAARYTLTLGEIEEAFRSATYTRKEVFKVHRHTGNPLETRGLVASYDAGRGEFTVWGRPKCRILIGVFWHRFSTFPSPRSTSSSPTWGRLWDTRRVLPRGFSNSVRCHATRATGEMDRGPPGALEGRQSFTRGSL